MFKNLNVFNFHLRNKDIATPNLGHKTILKNIGKNYSSTNCEFYDSLIDTLASRGASWGIQKAFLEKVALSLRL